MKTIFFFWIMLLPLSAYAVDDAPSKEFKPHIEFVYFEPSDPGQTGSLGINYEVSYSIKLKDPLAASTAKPTTIPPRLNFCDINLFSKGNVPFKKDFLIQDFIETGFDAGWQTSTIDLLAAPCIDDYCSGHERKASFTIKIAANYQYESDSDFKQKQNAYGIKGRITYKSGDSSIDRYFNPLEWLPSLIKFLAGEAVVDGKKIKHVEPFSEQYWPALGVAIEQVSPKDDQKRKLVDPQLDNYERIRLDLSYASTLFKVDADVIRVSFTWRYFKEISPTAEIKNAGLDNFSYWAVGLHTPKDVVISYSRGELPFDTRPEEVFKIGWNYKFY